MAEIEALATNAGEDLSTFSRYLNQQGIPHRITESAGRQIVLVGFAAHKKRVCELYEGLRDGSIVVPSQVIGDLASRRKQRWDWHALAGSLLYYKVVTVGIVLSLLGYLLVEFDKHGELLHFFTFYDFKQQLVGYANFPLQDGLEAGQFWRMLTPIFLHFGVLHIVFNMLWFWEFGRRIEGRLGSAFFATLVFVLGVGSNTIQSLFSKGAIFGGMSGVIYGLLGFCWLWDRVNPKAHFNLPPGIVGFMLIWLVLCVSGVVSAVGFGDIANAAHVSGLINGALLGALLGWYFRGHSLPKDG